MTLHRPPHDHQAPCAGAGARPLGRRALLLGAPLALGALAGCTETSAPPAVSSGPAPSTTAPVATSAVIRQAMTQISTAVRAADTAKKPQPLAPRVVGSAAEFRTRAYQIAARVPEILTDLEVPSDTVLVALNSTTAAYPRTAIALVADASDAGTHYFVGLSQADARAPYTTWGWARQAAGVTLPQVQPDSVGAAAVAADTTGLLMTPQAALTQYAAILTNGLGVAGSGSFTGDPFQNQIHAAIHAERGALNKGVRADSLATVRERYQVHPGELLGLRTADGGALVLGSLRSSRVITSVGGATITLAGTGTDGAALPEAKLAGRTTFTRQFVRDYGEVVALRIPPAGSSDRIQAIAVTRSLLGASGS